MIRDFMYALGTVTAFIELCLGLSYAMWRWVTNAIDDGLTSIGR